MFMIVLELFWLVLNFYKMDVFFGKVLVILYVMVMFWCFCIDKDVFGIVILGVIIKGFVRNYILYYKYMK